MSTSTTHGDRHHDIDKTAGFMAIASPYHQSTAGRDINCPQSPPNPQSRSPSRPIPHSRSRNTPLRHVILARATPLLPARRKPLLHGRNPPPWAWAVWQPPHPRPIPPVRARGGRLRLCQPQDPRLRFRGRTGQSFRSKGTHAGGILASRGTPLWPHGNIPASLTLLCIALYCETPGRF